MAVWCEVEGVIWVHKDSRFSINKFTKDYHFGVGNVVTSQELINDHYRYYIKFSFCQDGIGAAHSVHEWVKGLHDNKAEVEIVSEIRWLM